MENYRLLAPLLISALISALMGCSAPQAQRQPGEATLPAPKTVSPRFAASSGFAAQTGSLLRAYISIKDALVQSDTAATNRAADVFLAELAVVDASALPDTARGKWMDYRKMLDRTTATMKANKNLDDKRTGLEELSKLMYAAIHDFGVQTTVYKQYCPMALNDKGAFWLSAQPEIRNPYFGDQMLACGEVQEVLSGK